MGESMYRSTSSEPRHSLEVSGKLHVPADLPQLEDTQLPTELEGGGHNMNDMEK
jgi:hypothetical protein